MSNNQDKEKTTSEILTDLESGSQSKSGDIIQNSIPTETLLLLNGKRANSEEIGSEHPRKRRKSDEMESPMNDNNVSSHENKDANDGGLKSCDVISPVVVNNQNPLTCLLYTSDAADE